MTATIYATLTPHHSGSFSRVFTGLIIGGLITIGLFWVMQYLIETTEFPLDTEPTAILADYSLPKRIEETNTKIRRPKEPPKPEQQPPQTRITNTPNQGDPTTTIDISGPTGVGEDMKPDRGFSSNAEGDYLPIVKVAPIYPNQALRRGVEGYCIVQYTVTTLGSIKDVVVVEDQCSSSAFYNSSINAALKFKYKPRVVDGQAVEVTGVQNKFTFSITE